MHADSILLNSSKSSTGNNSNSPAAIAENAMRLATTGVGELDIPTMKKYIQYCKAKCRPRLSDEAGDILASSYVKIRDDVRKRCMEVSYFSLLLGTSSFYSSSNFVFLQQRLVVVKLKLLSLSLFDNLRLLSVYLKVWQRCGLTLKSRVRILLNHCACLRFRR